MNQIDHFNQFGYVRLGKLFSDDEVEVMKAAITGYDRMNEKYEELRKRFDQGEYPSFATIFVMNDVFRDNVFAAACRKPGILDFLSEALGDDAYLYHSKVALKYPNMAGFKWHQDYYYWYTMGCLMPKMGTCFIALDEASGDNGCLKVIPRSHLCGRIDHVLHDGFTDSECDPERVSWLTERFGVEELALKPGEVAAFHCNTLHSSEANYSQRSRLGLLGCFNTAKNTPINDDTHPAYSPQSRFTGEIVDGMDLPEF